MPSKSKKYGIRAAAEVERVSFDEMLSLAESLQKTSLQPRNTRGAKKLFDFVDTSSELADVVDKLSNLPVSPPSLFIDLEGVNLGRDGSISIIQIYVRPLDYTYLIDVFTLKEKAFSQKGASGKSLHDILEAPDIPKVIFDVRHDSDALYHHFNIKLAGMHDIQLMELATRWGGRTYICGLKKCVENYLTMSLAERQAWNASKEKGKELFSPELGGSYEVFNTRPLHQDIVQYCVQDVHYLPKLWDTFDRRLTPHWRTKVEFEVKNRIRWSQSPMFDGKGGHMGLGPHGWI